MVPRPLVLALVLLLATIVCVGVMPAPALARLPIAFRWVGDPGEGGSGYWGNPNMWSPVGVPTSIDSATIDAPGTYTVWCNGTTQAKTLSLGGSVGQQTLSVVASQTPDGSSPGSANAVLTIGGGSVIGHNGTLELEGSPSSRTGWVSLSIAPTFNPGVLTNHGLIRYDVGGGCSAWQLWGDLTNEADGAFVAAAAVTHNGVGTFTNRGQFTVDSGHSFDSGGNNLGFVNHVGDITNHGTFYFHGGLGFTQVAGNTHDQPILIEGCDLTLTGSGAASFESVGTLRAWGTLAPTQSITVMGANAYHPNGEGQVTFEAPFTAYGPIRLTSAGIGGGGGASLLVNSPLPGDALTIGPGGSLTVDSLGGGTRSLWGNLTNQGMVMIDANLSHSGAGIFDNRGWMTIMGGRTFDSQGNSLGFVNGAGGNVDNQGTFYFSGGREFVQGAGTTTGNPLVLQSRLQVTGPGPCAFTMVGNTRLAGALGANQYLTVESGTAYNPNASLVVEAPLTSAGQIHVSSGGGGGGGLAQVNVQGSVPADALTLAPGGSLIFDSLGGGMRRFSGTLVNNGIFSVGADTSHDGDGVITNRGTVTVNLGRVFSETGNVGFVNDAGGSCSNLGTFYYAGSSGKGFTQGAGTTSGNPVVIDSTLLAFTGSGASSFMAVGNVSLTGAMSSGQSLILKSGTAYNTNAHASMSAPFTNGGTITLASGGGGGGGQCQLGDANYLTNNNLITCDYSGGGTRQLSCAPDNFGTIAVSSVADQTGILTANGLASEPSGVLAVRIGGLGAGSEYDRLVSAYPLHLGGMLRATLVRGFVPVVGNSFHIVQSGGLIGTFATTDLPNLGPGKGWTVTYVPSSAPTDVVLTVVVDTVTAFIDQASPSNPAYNQAVSFSGHATDSVGHAITAYQWLDGATQISTAASFSFSTSGLTPGQHTIHCRARCANGTWSADVTTVITVAPPPYKNVYRFRNLKNGYYLWSADENEKATIIATLFRTWKYEGVAYQINPATNLSPLWRFVNIKGGFYLYSADANEKASIIANLSRTWRYEGPAYNVSTNSSGAPVWRFRNLKNGTYFYSADVNEKNAIVATLKTTWALEGPAYYLAP